MELCKLKNNDDIHFKVRKFDVDQLRILESIMIQSKISEYIVSFKNNKDEFKFYRKLDHNKLTIGEVKGVLTYEDIKKLYYDNYHYIQFIVCYDIYASCIKPGDYIIYNMDDTIFDIVHSIEDFDKKYSLDIISDCKRSE